MRIKEFLKTTKGKVIIGILAVLILGAGVTTFALTTDKGETAKESYDKKAEKMEDEEKDENSDSTDSSSEAQNEESSSNSADSSKTASKSNTDSSSTSKSSSSSSSSVASSKASSSSSSSSTSNSPSPKKEKKWVVDKPAWTETVKVPVTKYRPTWWVRLRGSNERKVYYDKNEWKKAYRSGDASQWGNGEDEAYTVYETKTVNHPEKGHWE